MKQISIVIPCFNEAEGLPMLAARLDNLVQQLSSKVNVEVIMVDDHSSDGSNVVLHRLCS